MQQHAGPVRAATTSEPRPEGREARRPHGPLSRLAAGARVGAGALLALGLVALPTVAFADEAPVPEPVQPLPVLVYGECAASLSVVELVPGRSYDIVVTDASGSVEYASGAWTASERVLDSFASVGPGEHTLVVTDIQAPTFQAVRSLSVAPCATTGAPAEPIVVAGPESVTVAPSISLEPATCDLLGTTDLTATFSGLGAGSYTAGVTSGGAPVEGVADRRVSASANSTVFADLANGGRFSVWIKDSTGTVLATAGITMAICDLPTLSDPSSGLVDGVEERTLAETGSAGAPLPLIAIAVGAALQGGALVGGLALMRRRTAARHAG